MKVMKLGADTCYGISITFKVTASYHSMDAVESILVARGFSPHHHRLYIGTGKSSVDTVLAAMKLKPYRKAIDRIQMYRIEDMSDLMPALEF